MLLPDEIFTSLGETNYDKFALSVVRLKERQERLTMLELQDKLNNDELETSLRPIAKPKNKHFVAKNDFDKSVQRQKPKEIVDNQSLQSSSVDKSNISLGQNNTVHAASSNNEIFTEKCKTNQQAGSVLKNPDGSENTKKCQEDVETKQYIKGLIDSKEAMSCPKCGILVMKDDGCSFVTCAACELEICFLSQKPRHPLILPDGRTIDGCHCMENGVKCHPQCTNCH